MRQERNVWLVGGDMRQVWLARLLAEDGHTVHAFALGPVGEGVKEERTLAGAERAGCVVLPLPAAGRDGALNAPLAERPVPLEEVFAALAPGQIVCAGRVDGRLRTLAEERGVRLFDYFAREELAVANAVPTAEGAVQIALEELPITLHGARALVSGYGRLGRALAPRLAALGARVTVAARRYEALAWAEGFGFDACPLGELEGRLEDFDLAVNTVPAPVLGAAELERLRAGCLVIDLASLPGGVDLAAAERLGVKAVRALSLPGKVAPATAAAALETAIRHILDELGV